MKLPWTSGEPSAELSTRQRYDAAAHRAAGTVIAGYSTSFATAASLLPEPSRTCIRDVYAMVRVADEIVDGACVEFEPEIISGLLDNYEKEVLHAVETGFSTDLVAHAFGLTARRTGISAEQVVPFFASMRADLNISDHNQQSLEDYVYGSAEVIGLMCLRCFLVDDPRSEAKYRRLAPDGQRLGAAFQKVNFLRDLAVDSEDLGRSYFEGVDPSHFDEAEKMRLVDDIQADLDAGQRIIAGLPKQCRVAVRTCHALFAELNARIRQTPAEELLSRRIRVPNPVKVRLMGQAFVQERALHGVSRHYGDR